MVFDFCIGEIYAPLVYGGSIVTLPSEEEKDMEAIQNKIFREHVTHVDFVPTMFTAFYHLDQTFSKLLSLDTIASGGGMFRGSEWIS